MVNLAWTNCVHVWEMPHYCWTKQGWRTVRSQHDVFCMYFRSSLRLLFLAGLFRKCVVVLEWNVGATAWNVLLFAPRTESVLEWRWNFAFAWCCTARANMAIFLRWFIWWSFLVQGCQEERSENRGNICKKFAKANTRYLFFYYWLLNKPFSVLFFSRLLSFLPK